MEDDYFTTGLSPVLIGLCAGALMAFVVLKLQDSGTTQQVLLPVVFVCCAPMCLDVVKKRGMSASIAETVMIVVSLILCVLYCVRSAWDEASLMHMLSLIVPMHLLALGLNIIRITWMNRRKEAQS